MVADTAKHLTLEVIKHLYGMGGQMLVNWPFFHKKVDLVVERKGSQHLHGLTN
jgi:hypothetical protein